MKIAGIIAEYNPFHNGHAYQIQRLKKETGVDYVIAVMSGDFVQRGEPAIVDKYTRARMALSNGVDLVIELPALWACASAEYFAAAGVSLLAGLGCVDILCFGAETDSPDLLCHIAKRLAAEPDGFQTALLARLKKGGSYPKARAEALADCLFSPDYSVSADIQNKTAAPFSSLPSKPNLFPGNIPKDDLMRLLASPNNILAIEYLKALEQLNAPLAPYIIKREGAAYHDNDITQKYASASAIREELLKSAPYCKTLHHPLGGWQNTPASSQGSQPAFYKNCALSDSLPTDVFSLLTDYAKENPFLSANDFSRSLGYLLLSCGDISHYADCTPEIAVRIQKNLFSYCSFSQFCALCKSRDVTYSRISRIFLHLLLGHTAADYLLYREIGYTPYARILGLRKEQRGETHRPGASTAPLLHKIKESSSLPLVPKLADAPKLLSSQAMRLLEKDIFAANLYEQTKYAITAANGIHADGYHSRRTDGYRGIYADEYHSRRTDGYRSEYARQIVIV